MSPCGGTGLVMEWIAVERSCPALAAPSSRPATRGSGVRRIVDEPTRMSLHAARASLQLDDLAVRCSIARPSTAPTLTRLPASSGSRTRIYATRLRTGRKRASARGVCYLVRGNQDEYRRLSAFLYLSTSKSGRKLRGNRTVKWFNDARDTLHRPRRRGNDSSCITRTSPLTASSL